MCGRGNRGNRSPYFLRSWRGAASSQPSTDSQGFQGEEAGDRIPFDFTSFRGGRGRRSERRPQDFWPAQFTPEGASGPVHGLWAPGDQDVSEAANPEPADAVISLWSHTAEGNDPDLAGVLTAWEQGVSPGWSQERPDTAAAVSEQGADVSLSPFTPAGGAGLAFVQALRQGSIAARFSQSVSGAQRQQGEDLGSGLTLWDRAGEQQDADLHPSPSSAADVRGLAFIQALRHGATAVSPQHGEDDAGSEVGLHPPFSGAGLWATGSGSLAPTHGDPGSGFQHTGFGLQQDGFQPNPDAAVAGGGIAAAIWVRGVLPDQAAGIAAAIWVRGVLPDQAAGIAAAPGSGPGWIAAARGAGSGGAAPGFVQAVQAPGAGFPIAAQGHGPGPVQALHGPAAFLQSLQNGLFSSPFLTPGAGPGFNPVHTAAGAGSGQISFHTAQAGTGLNFVHTVLLQAMKILSPINHPIEARLLSSYGIPEVEETN